VSAKFFPGRGNLIILLILFRLLTLQCKWSFTKRFTVSILQRKCTMKVRAPVASILKSFSSRAVYEFATRIYFLSSVTTFAELVHKSRYHCELHHGRRNGGQVPWIVIISPKKVVFLVSSRKKQISPYLAPPENFWKNPLAVPLQKKSFRRPWTPHLVWNWLERSTTTFAVLSLVCGGWTELTSEIFWSNGFLHYGYQKCFFFS